MAKQNLTVFIGALIAVVVAGYHANRAHEEFASKIAAQQSESTLLAQFKAKFDSMAAVYERWGKTFTTIENVADVQDIYRTVGFERYGLNVSKDEFAVASISGEGDNIGLHKACMRTVTETALEPGVPDVVIARAETMEKLIDGTQAIARRSDISIETIHIAIDKKNNAPSVAFGRLCLVMREA